MAYISQLILSDGSFISLTNSQSQELFTTGTTTLSNGNTISLENGSEVKIEKSVNLTAIFNGNMYTTDRIVGYSNNAVKVYKDVGNTLLTRTSATEDSTKSFDAAETGLSVPLRYLRYADDSGYVYLYGNPSTGKVDSRGFRWNYSKNSTIKVSLSSQGEVSITSIPESYNYKYVLVYTIGDNTYVIPFTSQSGNEITFDCDYTNTFKNIANEDIITPSSLKMYMFYKDESEKGVFLGNVTYSGYNITFTDTADSTEALTLNTDGFGSTVIDVEFNNLNTWLTTQLENSISDAYELNITGLTAENISSSKTSGTLGYILTQNNLKYVNLVQTKLPETTTDMNYSFSGCESLINAPVIPNSVTTMGHTFEKCYSLVNVPNIPDSVTNMNFTFSYCKALINAPVLSNNVTTMFGTFQWCTSLVNAPAIPNTVTYMNETFYHCTLLVNAPAIPNNVTLIDGIFRYCESLVNAPDISDGVTSMNHVFENCTSLVSVSHIPSSITELYYSFYKCTSLKAIKEFNCLPSNITSKGFCFTNVPSDLKIYVPSENLADWQSITPSDWGLTSTDVFVASEE